MFIWSHVRGGQEGLHQLPPVVELSKTERLMGPRREEIEAAERERSENPEYRTAVSGSTLHERSSSYYCSFRFRFYLFKFLV
jgi:hypothetical protein